ncbi:MAG: hypothetical protein ABSC00_10690 [Acidimicrobiales bacterium]
MVLDGVTLGWEVQVGTWAVILAPGGTQPQAEAACAITGTVWVANTPTVPPTLTTADNLYAELAALVHIATPTIFAMPSSADPGPQPCSSCTTEEDRVSAFANRPIWLAIDPAAHVTSDLVAPTQSACAGTACETIGITLVPTSVNFEWNGAEQAPPFNEPPVTISCAISGGGSSSSAYAPASVAQAREEDATLSSLQFQYAGGNTNKGAAVAGGPGCSASGSGSLVNGGTPPQSVDGVPNAGGGYPPVAFYTPTQVTGQDCTDVEAMPNHAPQQPSWCNTVPKDATLSAWVNYTIEWTFNGPAGAPPGLPTTYDVRASDPGNVATMEIPVLAEHVVITCVGGNGPPGGCPSSG